MNELTPEYEGRSVSFNCMVYGMDEEKTYYTLAVFECPNDCGATEEVRPDINKYIEVPKCNKCRKSMVIISEQSCTESIQNILMEEPLEEAIESSPNHKRGEMTGDLVGKVFIGQKKLCTGVFRSVYNAKTGRNDITIDIHSMEDVEKKVDCMPTDEEIEQYKIESQKNDWIDRLISSYTDKIGMGNIKLSILLSLVGGCKTSKMDRGDINVIIMGDPSVAKSQLLIFGQKITAGSRFVSGHSATGAGVIGGVGEVDGRRMYMGGAMSHCSGSHLFLDELDKMGRDHMDKMHEAMEKQTISGDYVGINVTLPAKTPIIAGANPKNSTYDDLLTIQQNFNIRPSLQSRFDLKWLVLDNKSEYELTKIAKYMTRPQEAAHSAYLPPDKLASFLAYAKKLEPIFTDEASSIIEAFCIKAKRAKKKEGIAVDYRTLEALIRITFAFAKLRLHETVTPEDATKACDLMWSAYESFGQDILTGITTQTTMDSAERKKDRGIWEALEELGKKGGGYFERDEALEVMTPVIGKIDALTLFDKLEEKSKLMRCSDGRYRVAIG
jgi:DNA replication licensing factor MCM4